MGAPGLIALDGPSPEKAIVRDMLRRALPFAPAVVLLFGFMWGVPGALSTAFGLGLVAANFALSATSLAMTARISLGLMMGTALFGFLVRLGLIFLAVLLVQDAWWFAPVPLGITIVVTHLGLLFWEMRYVSATLAFPGLAPAPASKES